MSIHEAILQLTEYGISKGLMEEVDKNYIINSYLDLFNMNSYEAKNEKEAERNLEEGGTHVGRIVHPARQNYRIIPIQIQGKKRDLQYSPYVI